MSGSKITLFELLIPLAVPTIYLVGKAAYYTGKGVVKGTILAGQLTAESIERIMEYQRQQNELRQLKLEQARQQACSQLQISSLQASEYCQDISSHPFMNDDWFALTTKKIRNIVAQCNYNLELEKAHELSQKLEKEVNSLKARMALACCCEKERTSLLSQLDLTRQTILDQRDFQSASELASLEDYRRRIRMAKIENFQAVKSEYSNWVTMLLKKIKSVQTDSKLKCVISALWTSLPVSQELAQQYDSAGYSELKRIESFIMSPNVQASGKEAELVRYKSIFAKHKAAVEVKIQQEEKLEVERAAFRKVFEPKLDELALRLAMTDKEIVNRWEKNKLANLTQQLEVFKTNFAQGQFKTMESDIAAWNESFDNMLTQAGLKQQAEDRRQYLIEAMKTELPKLGFDIQSLSSKADSASDTVIKVVPHTQKGGQRQRITITVPQNDKEPVNYKFDGYNLKHNRVEGRPVVENDTGKQTVMDIAAALKPYGISMTEPDWSGNPDKIQKNADSLPGDNNPAEELERSQSAVQYRSMELD